MDMAELALDQLDASVMLWECVNNDYKDCRIHSFNAKTTVLLQPVVPLEKGRAMWELFPQASELMFNSIIRAWQDGQALTTVAKIGRAEHAVATSYYRLKAVPAGGRLVVVLFEDVSDLEHSKERLHRELESQQHLLYFASHDLAEPLRGARVMFDLAMAHPESAEKFLLKADAALQRAQRLLTSLNEYRKLSNLDPNGAVCLADSLQEAKDGINGLAESGAKLEVGELPTVKSNRFALVTVLRNLVSNAVKYAKDGTTPCISITAERIGAWWRITVADSGIGFPPGEAESIFKLGHRVHQSNKVWGDGIGLANCRAAVASQGGAIWAESNGPGRGARFHFTVPAVDDSVR